MRKKKIIPIKPDCLSLEKISDKIIEKNRLNKINKSDLIRILNSCFNYCFTNNNSKAELLDTAYMLVQQNPANLMIFANKNKTVGPCKKDLTELLELSYYYTKRFLEEQHIMPQYVFEFYSYMYSTYYQYNKYNISDLISINTNKNVTEGE